MGPRLKQTECGGQRTACRRWKSALFYCHVGYRDWTEVTRHGDMCTRWAISSTLLLILVQPLQRSSCKKMWWWGWQTSPCPLEAKGTTVHSTPCRVLLWGVVYHIYFRECYGRWHMVCASTQGSEGLNPCSQTTPQVDMSPVHTNLPFYICEFIYP